MTIARVYYNSVCVDLCFVQCLSTELVAGISRTSYSMSVPTIITPCIQMHTHASTHLLTSSSSFFLLFPLRLCVALRGDRDADSVSISLAKQRHATQREAVTEMVTTE